MAHAATDGVRSDSNLFEHALNNFVAFHITMNAFAEVEIDVIAFNWIVIYSHFVAHITILKVYATGFDFFAQNWFHPIL